MRAILEELVELGYKTIAIDQSFDHSKREAGKRGTEMFPEPHSIEHLRKEFEDKLRILHRITILYVDVNVSHAMSVSMNLRRFNLIAGQPKTDAALTHCCTSFSGDIITFDSVAGSRLLVNRKAYQIAVRRGMFFEIKYAPAIADSSNRKDMIKVAQNYCTKGKSKNIIFSSGAIHEFQLRGPYDVANLAFIFGLSEDQGKNAIDRFCRQLFLRAESRRLGKTIIRRRSHCLAFSAAAVVGVAVASNNVGHTSNMTLAPLLTSLRRSVSAAKGRHTLLLLLQPTPALLFSPHASQHAIGCGST
ncbi:hypothetical protein ACLKA7_003864 [Drosophila subpalustris]